MNKNASLRKWSALLVAIIAYFVIHEGCHALVAMAYGAFEKVRLLGLGVQVVAKTELLSDGQIAVFCLVGSLGTLLTAYLLVALTRQIVKISSKLLKAIGYYTTFALLLIDPLYLTFIYKFVGGGDMNGILLLGLPEIWLQIIYGAIALFNILLFWRLVYPAYQKAFAKKSRR